MAECFHGEGCEQLVQGLKSAHFMWSTSKGRHRMAQLILAAVSFGLGLSIMKELPKTQLSWTATVNLKLESRCPCDRCEIRRRFRKIYQLRDEFGIIDANSAKQKIAEHFIRSNGLALLCDILDAVTADAVTYDGNHLVEHPNKEKNQSSIECPEKGVESDESERVHFDEKTQKHVVWTLLLCSKKYEERFDGRSVLSDSQFRPLNSILAWLKVSLDSAECNHVPENYKLGTFSILETCCTLLLQGSKNMNELINRSAMEIDLLCRPYFASLIKCLSTADESSRIFLLWEQTALAGSIVQVLSLAGRNASHLTQYAAHKTTNEVTHQANDYVDSVGQDNGDVSNPVNATWEKAQPPARGAVEDYYTYNKSPCIENALYAASIEACQRFYDSFCNFEETEQSTELWSENVVGLLIWMSTLIGIIDYNSVPRTRKRFLEPPNISCGWMGYAVRELSEMYGKRNEKCLLVKEISGIVSHMAERASAVLPATTAI